jgi:hypothetical protein
MLKGPGISKTETFHNTGVVGINLVDIPKPGENIQKTPGFLWLLRSRGLGTPFLNNGKSLS